MEEEVKKVGLSWSDKGVPDYEISFTYDTLLCIDQALVECNEILGEAGLGTGYESRQTTIWKLEEDHYTLNRYMGCLPQYVNDTLNLTEECYLPGMRDVPREKVTRKKSELRFSDFLGMSAGSVKGFADIFAAQYETMKNAGLLGTESVPELNEYLTQLSEQGEFSGTGHNHSETNHRSNGKFASST